MIYTQSKAEAFANEWIATWNSHNLERILSHYSDEVVFQSPMIVQIKNDPSGKLRGKGELRSYFAQGLKRFPDLKFTLRAAFGGVDGVTIYYDTVNNLTATETMLLNREGKVSAVHAHYSA